MNAHLNIDIDAQPERKKGNISNKALSVFTIFHKGSKVFKLGPKFFNKFSIMDIWTFKGIFW